jgi:hypothetical protein
VHRQQPRGIAALPVFQARTRRQRIYRRRQATALLIVLAIVSLLVYLAWPSSGAGLNSKNGGPAGSTHPATPSSIEAGVESWTLPSPLSRASVVGTGSDLTVAGGLDSGGASLRTVESIDPASGAVRAEAPLASVVHDASAATLGTTTFVFGGGSPATVATVQSLGPGAHGQGMLPEPRSDSASVEFRSSVLARDVPTAFVVGGYTGTRYLPEVLATRDGRHFVDIARLPVPVRYPAVAATGGLIYVFGGEVPSAGSGVATTDDIQVVDPATHQASVVGHLPGGRYGAAAFVIGHAVYVAGGQTAAGVTLTAIDAFVPRNHAVLPAGLLPQAEAFGAYTTIGTGSASVGYIVGGEVARQSGPDEAGQASGTLSTVISLRLSRWGGLAGSASSGSPFRGTLLVADRGNDWLLALDPARHVLWRYPSATMPPPRGGFYFPDDAFFIHHGTGIISNQENNDTIVEIGYPSGKVLWQYGHPGVPGSAPGYLDQPDDAYLLKSGVVTVADASNNRILFISPSGRILHQIGNGTDAHQPGVSLAYPNGDTPLANGDVLVSEINGSWVDEYTPSGRLVWSVQMPSVNYPSDPQQLGPDLFLMTDYDPPAEGRVLEFTKTGRVLWRYDAKSGEAALRRPSLAERLPNGLIMVNDDYNDRMVVIDPAINSIVWQYGLTGVSGKAPGLLSIPDGFDLLTPGGITPTHPQTG